MTTVFVHNVSDKKRLLGVLKETETPYRVTVKKGGTRSIQQNRYLWGVCYEMILEAGLKEQGWRAEDLHEYFLGEYFGWDEIEGFGRKRLRPVHRSSTMNKTEFVDFVEFIQQKAAEMGVVIPDPEWPA